MKINPKLKHLYSRAGFGLSPATAVGHEQTPIDQVVHILISDAKKSNSTFQSASTNDSSNSMASREKSKKLVGLLGVDWLKKMGSQDAAPLLERMSLFWHGHFACEIKFPALASSYLNSIRKHALGNFKEMVLAISKEPAMLKYLNNNVNRKNSPNENFARELLELFTIGIGNYTEQDIKEAARAFTGWTFSKLSGEFEFKERRHDFGNKTFMGKSGNFDGEDIINIILQQKETATFITTKIYKYFVNDKINSIHVNQLADIFYESDYDIELVMKTLFTADWFYDNENMGTKIKSPIELIAGMTNSLNVEFKNPLVPFTLQKILGQQLFRPPNVAGWKGGKSWIDNSTLLLRLNMANYFFNNADLQYSVKQELDGKSAPKKLRNIGTTLHFDQHLKLIANLNSNEKMELIAELVLQDPSKIDFDELSPFLDYSTEDQKHISLILRLMTMPEYQMC